MNSGKTVIHDYLIVGAGPAGLQLAYFLEQAGRDYVVLEAGDSPGTFFKTFPRHRRLISINKVYTGFDDKEINLRWDWNSLLSEKDDLLFKEYSGKYFPAADDLVRYLGDFAACFSLRIRYGIKVTKISKGGHFIVTDQRGEVYECRRLVMASGVTKLHIPEIPGIEHAELYSEISVDPGQFRNQRVLIMGKGNSGFEIADNLIESAAVLHLVSPSPIKMAWNTHFVGHLRAINNNLLDTYQLKSQNAILDATVERIDVREGRYAVSVRYTHADGERQELIYDRIIACTGWRFDDSIFEESIRPEMALGGRFPAQTSAWESTNVKDLYFAGTLMQVRDYKKTASGFIHGFRYNVRALHRIFERKYHAQQWPSRELGAKPEDWIAAIVPRLQKTSALWQQFGFLCDLIAVPEAGGKARYYEEMPVAYVHQCGIDWQGDYYLITLEFGTIDGDPFNIPRFPSPERAAESAFLHPVIRHYRGGTLIATHHLLEDLDAMWWHPETHLKPLRAFFERAGENAAAATPIA